MNVRTLCLGALCLRDGTGYDIKKLFEAAFNHFHSASYGSIYPALDQMEKEGLVSRRRVPGSRHPDRNIYSVTETGRSAFLAELAITEPREQLRSEFLVLMFFAHLLPTERLQQVLEQTEQSYTEELSYLESMHKLPHHTAGIDFTIEAGITHYQAMLKFLHDKRKSLLSQHLELPAAIAAKKGRSHA